MLQLGEEPLDQLTLARESLAEARLPAPVALGRDVGRGSLLFDQCADAVGIVILIGQQDRVRAEMIEQRVSGLAIMCLISGQTEPDRDPLRIDYLVDFARELTSRATEPMISIPLFAVAACW
jgi:hypothetical protein